MSTLYPTRPAAALATLPTPCLVLDRTILGRNLAGFSDAVARRGVTFRPHLKTAKCAQIARIIAEPPHAPITVSTLREAEYFAHHGWKDIFYAVCIGPGKLARAAKLHREGVNLVTMVDHPDAAAAITGYAGTAGVTFKTVIEIDCGDHRAGVPPDSPELTLIARALGPHFAGVAAHGGHSYAARSDREIESVARAEAAAVREASVRLGEDGFASRIVSIGSSPTAVADAELKGITEIRAGVFMFWDLFQAGLGMCRIDDIAVSVLAEVIGRPAHRPNEFLIDAGAFALSKDTSTAALGPGLDAGYGWVCDVDGKHVPGLRVARVWQEHGLVVSRDPLPLDSFPIGSRVRVLPNHACPTAAAYDRYHVIDGSPLVTAEWPRVNGW